MTVIVAGMVGLDLIPALPADAAGLRFRPGVVVRTGPARIAPGGCVANTGTALHRLGVPVRLLGKIGDDAFGRIVQDLLAGVGDRPLLVAPGETTAHSFVLSPPGHDRMILNYPGANNTFSADDIADDMLRDALLFHFGYPTAMARMFAESGRYLVELMARARGAGLVTSLDMSYPDPASPGGQADWGQILAATLPQVAVFMPSLAEAVLVLAPHDRAGGAGKDLSAEQVSAEYISRLGERILAMGAAIAIIKLGTQGVYLRTGTRERLAAAGGRSRVPLDLDAWAGRELWANIFEAQVAGTTGAGDATAAGLLLGLVRGMAPEDTVTAGCAVGGSSVEAADAVSAIGHWDATAARIAAGWPRRVAAPGAGWQPTDRPGVWMGPADTRRRE
jgi:sugar/nucleoside kinase (ribokinase family)